MKKIKLFLLLMMGILLFETSVVKASELKIHAIECTVQGDATLLETNGKYLLMDTCIKQDSNQVLTYLDNKQVTNFDIYLSHFHSDHYGLIMDILNNSKYTVKNIYLPEYNKNDSLINQINTVASQKNITVTYLKKGSEFNFENAKVSIIGPVEGTESLDNKINNNSLVAKIKIDDTTFLSAGDIEKEQEALLLKNNVDLKADIMKLSHHGGSTSNTTDFIKAVNPKYAFFHYFGDAEKNGFASDSWVKNTIANVNNFTNVLSTGYNGNIVYDINDNEISITPARNYVTATINYKDYDTNDIIKSKKIHFVKNTKFHYIAEDIPNYNFFGDDNLSGTTINDNKEINLYYVKENNNQIVIPKPLAAANTNETTTNEVSTTANSDANYCTEVDGTYYGLNGEVVDENTYFTDCKLVENPKTGHMIPILIFIIILGLGLSIYLSTNKYHKKRYI